jgi:hypothetical protein
MSNNTLGSSFKNSRKAKLGDMNYLMHQTSDELKSTVLAGDLLLPESIARNARKSANVIMKQGSVIKEVSESGSNGGTS